MIVLVHKRICNLIFYIFGMMLFLDCVLSSNPNILMMQPKALQRESTHGASNTAQDHYDILQPLQVPRWSIQGTENAPSRSANDDGNKASEDEAKIQDGELGLQSQLDLEIQPRMQPDNTSIQPQQTENDCCWKVKVAFTTNHLNGAYKLHKYIFGHYTMESGLVNGKPHYTSGNALFMS